MRGGWSRNSALIGALGWTAVCAYAGAGKAPLGVIELLFLFAILVIVPLGWVLGEGIAPVSSPATALAGKSPTVCGGGSDSFVLDFSWFKGRDAGFALGASVFKHCSGRRTIAAIDAIVG